MLGKGKKSLISATHAHPQQPLDGSKTQRDRESQRQRERGGGDNLAEQKRKSVLHRWMGENCRTAVIEIVSQPAMRFTYAPACVCVFVGVCVFVVVRGCECVCMYMCIYLCLLWASLTCFQYNKRISICLREEIVYAPPARVEPLLPKNNEATHICTSHTHKHTHTLTLA